MSTRAIAAAAQGRLGQHTHVAARAGASIPSGLKWWEQQLLREMLPAETLRWLTRLCEPARKAVGSGYSDQARSGREGPGRRGPPSLPSRYRHLHRTATTMAVPTHTGNAAIEAAHAPDKKTDSVCRYWLNCQRNAQQSGETRTTTTSRGDNHLQIFSDQLVHHHVLVRQHGACVVLPGSPHVESYD